MAKKRTEQQKMKRFLASRKQTLLNKGANPQEVMSYFHGVYNLNRATPQAIKRAYQQAKATNVTVINGKVLPTKYAKNLKLWYGKDYNPSMVTQNFKQASKSKLMQYDSFRQIQNHKRVQDLNTQRKYIERLRYLRDSQKGNISLTQQKKYTQIINSISRMGRSDFKNFISTKNPFSHATSFEAIFFGDSDQEVTWEQETEVSTVFSDIDTAFNALKASKNRR